LAGSHVTVPMVKLPPLSALAVVFGVTPLTGAIMEILTEAVPIATVAGNTAVTTPELASLLANIAPATVKKLAFTP